jgi:hypothetical protein
MKIYDSESVLRRATLELNRTDLVVLRRVCSHVGGANVEGSRAVTDKLVSLIDARDPTVATDAAALTVADPDVILVFTD